MPIESGPQFLKQKYDLHNKPEVEAAASRTNKRNELRAGEDEEFETVGQDPDSRIENYINRFAEIAERTDPDIRRRGLDAIKHILHKNFIIKPDEIPESYWEAQQRMAREQGHGDIEITDQMREQGVDIIIADQRSSLDKWIDYLSTDDATYPNWLKYYAIRGMLTMGGYNKEKHEFSRRSKGTTKPFPDLDREALAYVLDAMEKHYSKAGINLEHLVETDQKQLKRLLEGANFAKLYAWALEKVTPAEEIELLITEGEWVKYNQGSDPLPLVHSLEGHGTGWCTAGESTARVQLEAGDFYVYYTYSRDELLKKRDGQPANPRIPRAAIRMEQDRIAEVRGVAPEQNLDAHIADVVREKMKEFPDGSSYEKKAYDMQMLTYIERKTKAGQQLNKNELVFLYEINGSIKGFGYDRDPRVEELRTQRNPNEDAPIVFECQPEEIAHAATDISEATKAYIGQLEPGIFDRLPKSLEHIYTTFPEGKIRRSELTIGGRSKEQLTSELRAHNINISQYAEDMINSPDFATLESPEPIDLVRLKVSDLGFTQYPTTDQLYAKAAEFGLELCPAEVGPHQRLVDANQPLGEWYYVAMKPITDRDGDPDVFYLGRNDGGPWLGSGIADPTHGWRLGNQFVFRVRKVSPEPYSLNDFELP